MLTDTSEATYVLFLDLKEFESMRGLRLCLNSGEKHPENPVLRPTPGAWDHSRAKCYGAAIHDRERRVFRMWYSGSADDQSEDWAGREGGNRRIGYAESPDGVHWTKPVLGIIEHNGSRENNLVLPDGQAPCVYRLDDDPPYRMYFQSGSATRDMRLALSDDGIRWRETPESPLIGPDYPTYPGVHEPYSILYDPEDHARAWKAYSLLHWIKEPGGVPVGRSVGLWTSRDGVSWIAHPSNPIMSAEDGPEYEIHLPAVFRYRGYYLMFRDFMYINNATDMELAASRDGVTFARVMSGHKLIPLGAPGDWDSGMVCVAPRSFIERDGRLWYYYAGSPDTYREGPRSGERKPWRRYTGLARWRVDGLTHLEADEAGGEGSFTTVPITVAPELSDLLVNADCSDGDSRVSAAVLDARRGEIMPGYDFSDCVPVGEDTLTFPLRWRGRPFGRPGTGEVKLSFRIRGRARIYSFRFRGLEGG